MEHDYVGNLKDAGLVIEDLRNMQNLDKKLYLIKKRNDPKPVCADDFYQFNQNSMKLSTAAHRIQHYQNLISMLCVHEETGNKSFFSCCY